MPTSRVAIIAAGGTGGHIYPGIAVADELRQRDPSTHVVFVGTSRGLEQRLVTRAGYELETLPILPLNSVGLGRLLLGMAALPWAMTRAVALLWRRRPSAVLGVGGYAGGPVVLLAALAGIPTTLLEPNAHPGFTNRVLKPFVRHAACGYEVTRAFYGSKGVLTGNPVRRGFAEARPRVEGQVPRLLVFGGSQGSHVLNMAMIAALPRVPGSSELGIVHQTGTLEHVMVRDAYRDAGREAEVVPFLDDMDERFAAADLILCRSGATTCAELAVAGRASILVPFARAANDHQTTNARTLSDAGAAVMITERHIDGARLAATVDELIRDHERRGAMERAARALGRPDAASRVADLMGFAEAGVNDA